MYPDSLAYAAQECVPDRPYLAKVSDLADEAMRIGDYIDGFIARCRGGCGADGAKALAPVPSGHLGNLDRLTENLGRIDKLARELQTIG